MTFEYRSVEPAGELRRFVSQVWFARGVMQAPRERVAPTGSAVLGIVLGDPIRQTPGNGRGEPHVADRGFLIGPDDRAMVNEPTGETWAVGVVATPVGCRAAFGVLPAIIRGRVVDAAVWPGFAVREELAGAGADDAIAVVEDALLGHLGEPDPGMARVETAIRSIEEWPATPIAALAGELGVSHGHLDREFGRIVGLTPRALSRVLRLRALVASIDVYGGVEWTRLATELGWFDQAHLIRDFRRFTGVTPGEYATAIRERYTPEEALPGFTPER